MPKAITDSWLRAKSTTRETRTEWGGLVARKGPAGTGFYVRYMIDRRGRWVHIGSYKRHATDREGMTLAQARAEAAAMIVQAQEARQGRSLDPAAEHRGEKAAARVERLVDPTVREFAKVYIERHAKPRKKTWREDERILHSDVFPLVGELKFAALERKHYIAILDRKVDAGRPKQAGEVLKVIRKMENFAIERGQITASRLAGIKAPAKSAPRRRVLWRMDHDKERSEIAGLAGALAQSGMHPGMKAAIWFQLLTAQRPGAVQGAQWKEIDGKKGIWLVPAERMKRQRGGQWEDLEHVVPLSSQALKVLDEARRHAGDSPFVFPGRVTDQPWNETAIDHEIHRPQTLAKLREHGVDRFNLHDLRRSAVTIMTAMGVAPHIVERVLGHVPSGVVAEHYDTYSYFSEMRDALQTLGAAVDMLKAGERIKEGIASAKIVPLRSAHSARS